MQIVTSALYHNIADRETEFERGLHVTCPLSIFKSHINFFSRWYTFVSLEEVLSRQLPRNPLLVTFDDCYLSALEAVESILVPRGIPSVFFLNPDLLGEDCFALDNLLALGANTCGLEETGALISAPPRFRGSLDLLINGFLSSLGSDARMEIRDRLLTALRPASDMQRARILVRADFRRFEQAGVEVGNHTASHVHCRALSRAEIEREIVGSKEELESLSGERVRALSIPYGHTRDATPAVVSASRDAGHEAIFLVHARINVFSKSPTLWYRVAFDSKTMSGPVLRAVVLPWLRTVRAFCRHRREGTALL